MSLTPVLLLIALAGLVAALWVQLRGLGLDRAEFRRRQAKAGLGLLALLVALGLVQFGHDARVLQRLTAPAVDGGWAAESIDGDSVPWREWRLSVARGRVAGGRDGCNDWGFDEPEVEGGERMIVTTLVECPEGDPVREAYWALAVDKNAVLELREEGRLRISARGHVAELRRCRWVSEPLPPGTSGTGPRVCAVD